MNRPAITSLISLITMGIALSMPAWSNPASDLDAVLDRIDKAGAAFRGMSAKVRRVSHTAVINEDNIDSGTILVKRPKPRDLRMLIDITDPDRRTVAFSGRKLEVYYPKIQTVQEFDVAGKNRELADEFFLIGFGTSRADLQASYTLRLVGTEAIEGQKADRLELIPKSKEILQHLTKFELWISAAGYPIRQKFYLPGGDYQLATYADVRINPQIADADLKLHVPKNVKREYPQK
jgi:outer membrane lipoprotein-sorting protein